MTEFEINKLCYYAPKKGYYVKLKEFSGDKIVSILIDREEVQAIALSIEGVQPPRPTTHDLITDIIFNFDIKIKKIEFHNYININSRMTFLIYLFRWVFYDILNDSIYVNLYLQKNKFKIKKFDCRPSDAIALALRENCSIFISDKIINKMDPISDTIFDGTGEFKNQGIDRKEIIIKKLKFSMKNAIKTENYEFAAKIRDKIESMDDN